MIIKIEYYPDAKDKMDADAATPEFVTYAQTFEDGTAFIGKLERMERAAVDKAILEAEKADFPF